MNEGDRIVILEDLRKKSKRKQGSKKGVHGVYAGEYKLDFNNDEGQAAISFSTPVLKLDDGSEIWGCDCKWELEAS